MTATFAVVAGGGTAGHVLPALAVADSLVAAGHDPGEIHYFGAQRGIETRLLPDTSYRATYFDVVGLQRSLSRRNLGFVPRMWRAVRAATTLLRAERPRVVVSVGGYASVPAVIAARRLHIPIVVVSYDRTPGRASRLAARWAVACAVAFDGSTLPRAAVVGAPVRQAILDVDRAADRAAARSRLGIDDTRFVLAVMGGSLGSGVLNDAVAAHLRDHAHDDGLAVRQIAGERFAAGIERSGYEDARAGAVQHQVVAYEAAMPDVYAACDLLVGRGGASTVHEVAVTGTPAVLVPWAGSADDHQTDNVRWLSEVGAAILLPEAEIGRLGALLDDLRADPARRLSLSVAARTRGEVHRSGALAALIDRVAADPPSSLSAS